MNNDSLLSPILQPSSILLVGTLSLVFEARAGVYQSGYDISISERYTSNPYLQVDAKDSVYSSALQPSMWFQWGTPSSELELSSALKLERSSNEDLVTDRNDPSLAITYTRQGSRSQLQTAASYKEVSTSTVEIFETGKIDTDGTRKDTKTDLIWTYKLSEFSTAGLSGSLSKADYKVSELTDYKTTDLDVYFEHRFSEEISAKAILKTQTYSPGDELGESSRLSGMMTSINFRISENIESDFGVQTVYMDEPLGPEKENFFNGVFKIAFSGERSNLTTVLSRETIPTGLGRFITADNATLDYSYTFSQKANIGLSAQWREADSIDHYQASLIELRSERRLNNSWRATLGLQHKRLERDEAAYSNIISISLNYSLVD
ncbi:hypothetical protein [Microbulbifer mangrovi]|uniref:hypothetical protein n=1 Tax=Microbulbifer mangrovi TaxID=927787 RepID=UPI00099053F5|nr:hypothetical protein [Microbulbifer mangrovi]